MLVFFVTTALLRTFTARQRRLCGAGFANNYQQMYPAVLVRRQRWQTGYLRWCCVRCGFHDARTLPQPRSVWRSNGPIGGGSASIRAELLRRDQTTRRGVTGKVVESFAADCTHAEMESEVETQSDLLNRRWRVCVGRSSEIDSLRSV